MSSNALKLIKPKTESEKRTKTVVDTITVTPSICQGWLTPPFQRPIRENDKVRALAEDLKRDGGVWPGVVTLGVLDGDTYCIDGQHRKHAFLMSGVEEGYTDVRIHYFTSMAEMGREFVELNSQLVRMRPDDILRGLEDSVSALKRIRDACPFVGYDHIRRSPSAPMVSMSAVLRCWRGSAGDVPGGNVNGNSAAQIAASMETEDAIHLTEFLTVAVSAFGRDPEYMRLWGALNITVCMWLYRKLVLSQYSPKTPRLTKELFRKCLMSVSAASEYIDWLLGRQMGDRDRSPAYAKIKAAFASRLFSEMGSKPLLPQPSWAHGGGGHGKANA